MSERIERLKEKVLPQTHTICATQARLITDSLIETEGDPDVIRTAKAQAALYNNIPIFIEDDELIVGNTASKP
ncbi:pyruvate formate lyase family protein, partial [Thermodesulfobacteriota bacterium]